jgi:acyl-CoA thioester hydrolase
VKTTLKQIRAARIWFTYRLYNETGELVNEAETELAFVQRDNWKPCMAPDFVFDAVKAHHPGALFHA